MNGIICLYIKRRSEVLNPNEQLYCYSHTTGFDRLTTVNLFLTIDLLCDGYFANIISTTGCPSINVLNPAYVCVPLIHYKIFDK
jgi:hypothetical protein